jgi:hypothetical protein
MLDIQFPAANHITQDENMAMSTDRQKDPRHCKERKHFLSRLWARVLPSLNTSVNTLSKVVKLCHVEPSNILTIKISIR